MSSKTSYMNRPSRPLAIYAVLYLAFLYVPVLFLPLFSFNDSLYITFPLKGFTLDWYKQMLENDGLHQALWNSVRVAFVSAVVATGFGILGAKALTRYKFRGQKPLTAAIMAPLVIPEIILGISLLILVNSIGMGLSLYSVSIGHILITVPFAIAVLMSRMEGFDKSLEEASMDLGESAWSTFWRVTFPLIFPGILSSMLLCFTISFDEFIIAFFLAGTEATLPVFMWSQLRFPQKLPGVLALGAIILVVSTVLVILSERIRRIGVKSDDAGTPLG